MATGFVPGLELAGLYYADVVRPLLDRVFPGLRHSAALVGSGSDVLGFDSPRSTDHDWGPRLILFLDDERGPGLDAQLAAMFARELPESFRGYPTRFPDSHAPQAGPRHWVTVAGLGPWLTGTLGFDPRRGVTTLDWLATPTQLLAEVTGGAVFHDGLADPGGTGGHGSPGGLTSARDSLSWYPDDVWRHVLASQWQRISQEEAFPGRCAEADDELGSAVVAARLVRDMMRLCLLLRRRYPPYSKWLGTAFSRLPEAARLGPKMRGALAARAWPEREGCLCACYEAVAGLQNDLGLATAVGASVRQFYERPYRVIDAGRIAGALRASIGDPAVRGLGLPGAADQVIDNTDALGDKALIRAAMAAAAAAV